MPISAAPYDLLVIGAHPDDAELFAGGAMAAAAAADRRVAAVSLTRGEGSSRGTPALRADEAAAAAAILGVDHALLELPDGAIADTVEQRRIVAGLLRTARPRLVATHAPRDRHPDHDAAHALVRAACFLANVARAPIAGERHLVERLVFFFGNHEPRAPQPELIVDISATFARKREALAAYRSQFAVGADTLPSETSLREPATYIASDAYWRWIETRARYYGGLIGADYGEPFLLDGPRRATDLLAALF